MAPRMVFRYRVEFAEFHESIADTTEFARRCAAKLGQYGIDLFSNEMMNWIKRSDGMVFRDGGTVTEEERQTIIDWITQQPLHATLTAGYLENFGNSSVVGDFEGDSFQIANI